MRTTPLKCGLAPLFEVAPPAGPESLQLPGSLTSSISSDVILILAQYRITLAAAADVATPAPAAASDPTTAAADDDDDDNDDDDDDVNIIRCC